VSDKAFEKLNAFYIYMVHDVDLQVSELANKAGVQVLRERATWVSEGRNGAHSTKFNLGHILYEFLNGDIAFLFKILE